MRDRTKRDRVKWNGIKWNRMKKMSGVLLSVMVMALLNGCMLISRVEERRAAAAHETQDPAGQKPAGEAQDPAGQKPAQEAQDPAGRGASGDEMSGDRAGTGTENQLLFEGQDMDGNRVTSEIMKGSGLTMVNVWATYCNPCLREMPGLGELAGEYDQEDFQIIGIISDVQEGADQEMLDLAADLIERTGAAYPHLLLNESLYRGLLRGVTAVPTTFFFNADGELLETEIGSMEKADWKEKIDGFLGR